MFSNFRKNTGDRHEKLDYAERWIRDGLSAARHGDFFESVEVDMTRATGLIEEMQNKGINVSYPHIYVRAVALTFSKHPKLHQLISENQRIFPKNVDIGLSVLGRTVVAPVLVIKEANNKSLVEVSKEVIERAPQVRKKELEMLANYRRWGWLMPFGSLRRLLIKFLMRKESFRRENVGTFQITCLPKIDLGAPFLFLTSAILGVAGVKERVIAIDGKPEVRLTAIFSCCVDHKVWDGADASKFLNELKSIIESGEIE